MTTTDPRREQIRRILAEADGFNYECLEPHDYQRHVDALLAAAVSSVPPPADRAALRDRIAEALERADYRPDMRRGDLADAIMPVLPAPADRAAVLCEAADRYATLVDQNEAYELAEHGEIDHESRLQFEAVRDVVTGLRRMAAEEQPAEDAAP